MGGVRANVTVHQLTDGNAFLNVLTPAAIGTIGVGVWSSVVAAHANIRMQRAVLALGPEENCRTFALIVFDSTAALADWMNDDQNAARYPLLYEITPGGLVPLDGARGTGAGV